MYTVTQIMLKLEFQSVTDSLVVWCIAGLICAHLALTEPNQNPDFYSFTVLDAQGKWISMDRYRGQVLLVVNVASECGFTDGHYKGLVKLQDDLGPSGRFQVLAFPCNQFGSQEPKDSPEILHFAEEKYGVNFPIFHKINVINSDVPELWRHLEEKTGKVPSWNFWKYLVDSRGSVLNAWGPWTQVDEIYTEIKDAVAAAEQTVKSTRDFQDL